MNAPAVQLVLQMISGRALTGTISMPLHVQHTSSFICLFFSSCRHHDSGAILSGSDILWRPGVAGLNSVP